MRRGLTALAVGMTAGLGVVAPALAGSGILASSGDATSVSDTAADLNGVVFSPRPGAHWRFILSEQRSFRHVELTPAVALHGRLVAVERRVGGLAPATTYFWRVELVSPAAVPARGRPHGHGRGPARRAHALTTLGEIRSFTTLAAGDSGTGTTTTSTTTTPSSTTTTGTSTTTTSTTPTSTTPTTPTHTSTVAS